MSLALRAVAFVAIALLPSLLSAQPNVQVGRVAAIEGAARVARGGAQATPLRLDSPLFRADTINTEAGARLRIALQDDTTVILGELSTLTISRVGESREGRAPASRLTIGGGVARIVAQAVLPRAEHEVRTPTAIAAVRGTEYLLEVKPTSSAFAVLKGIVAVSNARADVRGAVLVNEGQGTDVASDRPPTPPTTWGAERLAALQRATRPH